MTPVYCLVLYPSLMQWQRLSLWIIICETKRKTYNMEKTLDALRNEIDVIDKELLHNQRKRMVIVGQISKLKKEKNIKLRDEERWQNVLMRIKDIATKQNLSEDLVKKIYEEIHKAALTIEKNV